MPQDYYEGFEYCRRFHRITFVFALAGMSALAQIHLVLRNGGSSVGAIQFAAEASTIELIS